MNTTNPQLRDALNFDPIAEAEKRLGIDHWSKDQHGSAMLGMALMHQDEAGKEALLFLNKDTNAWKQTLTQFVECIEAMGFRQCVKEQFNEKDSLYLYWNPKGILLCFDSYEGTRVNGGNAYWNYCGPRDALHSCTNGTNGDQIDGQYVWQVARDCREGLKFAIEECEANGSILPKWTSRPFLWLLHYADTKDKGYDSNAINAARIAMLPKEVQEAITP